MQRFNTRTRQVMLAMTLALALQSCAERGAEAPQPSRAGANAAKVSFALPTDDGALVSVPLGGAKATVLDFFSPTCEPCKTKLPELLRKRDDIERKGARIVLVAVLAPDEPTERARDALRDWGVTSGFLVDRGSVSQRELGVTGLPSTAVLDASGAVMMAPTDASPDAVLAALK